MSFARHIHDTVRNARLGEDFVVAGTTYRKVYFAAETGVSCVHCCLREGHCNATGAGWLPPCYANAAYTHGRTRGIASIDAIPGLMMKGLLP